MKSDVQEAERGPDQLQCEWFGEQLRPPGNPSNIYQCSGRVIIIIIIIIIIVVTLQHISVFGYSSILIILIVVVNMINIYFSKGIKIQQKSELPIV